jgi:hypothetical protein
MPALRKGTHKECPYKRHKIPAKKTRIYDLALRSRYWFGKKSSPADKEFGNSSTTRRNRNQKLNLL